MAEGGSGREVSESLATLFCAKNSFDLSDGR
jgi:hypothetical protein